MDCISLMVNIEKRRIFTNCLVNGCIPQNILNVRAVLVVEMRPLGLLNPEKTSLFGKEIAEKKKY